ncbi:DUF6531 domain-containing protein [Collimonas humicola]|uniref:DUF6531 domain-containing protein n=1 Tax=Collimonas humicola TaxID=2825886 RepID=UPI001B8C47A4|nr:DUF6531 domain-containing protein [Collimonas humicola]
MSGYLRNSVGQIHQKHNRVYRSVIQDTVYRKVKQDGYSIVYQIAVLCALLLAVISVAHARTSTFPAKSNFVGTLEYSDCGNPGAYNEKTSYSDLETAGAYYASKRVSAINCAAGQIWHYNYAYSVLSSYPVWQMIGKSQYNGDEGVLGNQQQVPFCPEGSQATNDPQVCACPAGQIHLQGQCQGSKDNGPPAQCPIPVGTKQPIHAGTGNKYWSDIDYIAAASSHMLFRRQYNSQNGSAVTTLGNAWRHDYDRFIEVGVTLDNTAVVVIGRPNGTANSFTVNGNVYIAQDADVMDKLTQFTDTNGVLTGWKYQVAINDSTEIYDANGRLISLQDREGLIQNLTYSDSSTPPTIAPKAGLLLRVADTFGRQLNFTYDRRNRIVTMIDPAGELYQYNYDANNNLISIAYPNGKSRVYLYNEQAYTDGTNQPHALTGMVDENGNRFASYFYNAQGKAYSEQHAGGVDQYQLTYSSDGSSTTITDPLGTARTTSFTSVLGSIRATGQSQPGGAGCAAASSKVVYDINGNVASRTDFNGTPTTYSYDLTRNLEASRVEGSGTPLARTITSTWHTTYRLPLQIAEPKLLTTYAYDTSGNLLSKTMQATSDVTGAQGLSPTLVGTARIWSYTYNSVGQVLTATGPRTDVADKTIYTYDSSGNLSTITNAVGQVTTLSNYDANGRVGLITDANGATTALIYSPRGWLTGKTATSGGTVEATTYGYDGVGQLILVTLPNTSTVSYTYDPAHRLTNIADSLGNSIVYTLDNMGNRIGEQIKDPSGALARQTSRVVDALNRIQQITGAVQ